MTTAELCKIAKVSDEGQALRTDDLSPSRYINLLSEKKLYKDAIKFLAHGLPVKIAIQWACCCIKEFQSPQPKPDEVKSLAAAEKWLKEPTDTVRWEAKEVAGEGDKTPAHCAALAVFFSGGSIASAKAPPTPPPAYSANKLVAGSILAAAVAYQPAKAEQKYIRALDIGRDLVKAGGVPAK